MSLSNDAFGLGCELLIIFNSDPYGEKWPFNKFFAINIPNRLLVYMCPFEVQINNDYSTSIVYDPAIFYTMTYNPYSSLEGIEFNSAIDGVLESLPNYISTLADDVSSYLISTSERYDIWSSIR
jgi:hypothetical protein